ncbi:MAG: diacylglycerol kinase family lipid kinase [Lachnospiraceae bacterium]|nr:diacylglycerol kinase family lipid kinase [Lachnospiraceae bacterium]MDY5774402.1 diacylglycerol kinase family lipid kinase [Lachnospiraceae bacterium]
MKKLLFVINGHSGKGQIKNRLLEIIDVMVQEGYQVTVHTTQAREDATNVVREQAKDYDLIVCSGGDGTLDETVTGLMQSGAKVPIGYIPAGSTNDFANSLKIPKNMLHAGKTAVTGRRFPCDVGEFNGDFFIYVAAFGIFTDVSYATSQELKNVLGHVAYILEGAKRLHTIKSYHMRVEYDGQETEGDFLLGMITNSTSVGGFKGMTGKNVKLDDGLFEVTLIHKPKNIIELNEIIASLTNLKDTTDLIDSFRADEVRFYAEEEIPWTLDGEFGGDHREVLIQNHHQAMEIMVKEK